MCLLEVKVEETSAVKRLKQHIGSDEGLHGEENLYLGLVRILEVALLEGVLGQVHESHQKYEHHHVEYDVAFYELGEEHL